MVSVLRGGIGLCIVEVGSLLGVYGMGYGGQRRCAATA